MLFRSKAPDVPSSVLNVAVLPLDDYLSPFDIEITESSGGVGPLLEKMASGRWSAEAVVVSSPVAGHGSDHTYASRQGAYSRRAIIAHKLTNCVRLFYFGGKATSELTSRAAHRGVPRPRARACEVS